MSTETGWRADPTGRHELRYHSGSSWTVHVADNGAVSVDSLPVASPQTASERPAQAGALPGWYRDPWNVAWFRWFDGQQWTPATNPPAPEWIDASDPLTRIVLPVGRTGLSIVAGYAGLCSILLFPAPVALGLGIAALAELKRRPEKYGRGRAIFAIIAGGLGSVLLALVLWTAFRSS